MEYDIRVKSELLYNVRNNSTIPSVLTHNTTVCRIDGNNIIDWVGESKRNKTSHKKLIPFFYDIGVLKINPFDLVDCTVFEKNQKRFPPLLQIWAVKYMSSLCRGN